MVNRWEEQEEEEEESEGEDTEQFVFAVTQTDPVCAEVVSKQ